MTNSFNNTSFSTAAAFINNSRQAVFLTGKAGTGKTTFLKYIKENTPKNCAIVAPTGVAAINAGGTTIHSFFQLPFSPYIPFGNFNGSNEVAVDKHSLFNKIKLSTERKEVMQQLELLIIDEISMVRADVLDAIDTVLRAVRSRFDLPFGGVQVLYIGDLYQLPPVVKEEEWALLREYYDSPFFFSSLAVKDQNPVYIELQHVYRQSDAGFIALLNQVRNNQMDTEGYQLLQSRFNQPVLVKETITLTTHNYKADVINNSEMEKLPGKEFIFRAIIEGDFPDRMFPVEEELKLKEGAQVMFIKNDMEKIRRYFNGKIGRVSKITDDKIFVLIQTDAKEQEIEVKKDSWKNIKYSVDKRKQHIEEEELGSFTHYPLKLAWAITIHKSQGLTFDHVIIDAEKAFAPGQVYVALSRCRTLDGIVLNSRIAHNSLRSDERIVAFSSRQTNPQRQELLLKNASRSYQEEILLELTDFKSMHRHAEKLKEFFIQQPAFGKKSVEWATDISTAFTNYAKHGSTFGLQLQALFNPEILPENNPALKDRFVKAAGWFATELSIIKEQLKKVPAVTDNRQVAMDFFSKVSALYQPLAERLFLLEFCRSGFSAAALQQQKAAFEKEKYPVNIYSGAGTQNEGAAQHNLQSQLRAKRNQLAVEKNTAVYLVCSSEALEQMANYLPQTEKDLEKIKGLGRARIKQYGKEFLILITAYCEFFELESRMHELEAAAPKKKREPSAKKPDTKLVTFDLFQQGKNPAEIASIRNLSIGTIEGHLEEFVKNGSIEINRLLQPEDQHRISKALAEGITGYAQVKEALPQYTYGQIRWVAAALEREKV